MDIFGIPVYKLVGVVSVGATLSYLLFTIWRLYEELLYTRALYVDLVNRLMEELSQINRPNKDEK